MGTTPFHNVILPAVVARHVSSVAVTTYPVGYHPVGAADNMLLCGGRQLETVITYFIFLNYSC